MSSPIQVRSIDPYSNYGSDIVSNLTKMITNGTDCIHSQYPVDISIDSTAVDTTSNGQSVILSSGIIFKDNILIDISSDFTIDMSDSTYYTGPPLNETGYYWILANYKYRKILPVPEMSITILKPTQVGLWDSDYHLFLKAVKISYSSETGFYIESVHDSDPNDLTGNGIRILRPLTDPSLLEQTITPANSITIDWENGATASLLLNRASTEITMSNQQNGRFYRIKLTQDGSGSRLVTWIDTIRWRGGTAPTLTTTLNKADFITIIYSESEWYADINKNF